MVSLDCDFMIVYGADWGRLLIHLTRIRSQYDVFELKIEHFNNFVKIVFNVVILNKIWKLILKMSAGVGPSEEEVKLE